jgi:hypothetical protein
VSSGKLAGMKKTVDVVRLETCNMVRVPPYLGHVVWVMVDTGHDVCVAQLMGKHDVIGLESVCVAVLHMISSVRLVVEIENIVEVK